MEFLTILFPNGIEQFIADQIANNQFLVGGVVTTALMAIGYQLRAWPRAMMHYIRRKTIYRVVIEEGNELYGLFNQWLYDNKATSFRNIRASLFVPGRQYWWRERKADEVADDELRLEQFVDSFLFFFKRQPIWMSKEREKLEGAMDFMHSHKGSFVLTTFFDKHKINQLLKMLVDQHNKKEKEEYQLKVFTYETGTSEWKMYKKYKPLPLDSVIMNNKTRKAIINDIEHWVSQKDKIRARGKTFKRGYMFHGAPGCGKSSLAAAIGYKYRRNIYYLDINSIPDEKALKSAFAGIRENSILLIEDIDAVWKGRTPVNDKCKITFSFFLNLLNGVLDKDNLMTIITTNKPEELDPALVRKGRIDFQVEIMKPDADTVKQYIDVFYEGDYAISKQVIDFKNFATIENLCESNPDSPDKIINYIESGIPIEEAL